MSTLYRSSVTQILLFARSSRSTTLWASLCGSSIYLDNVRISTGDKFSSVAKFSTAIPSWFFNSINWLKFASPVIRCRASRNSLLSTFLKPLSFTSKCLDSFLDQENRPNLSWHLPNSTYTVEVNLSQEAAVSSTMGGRDRMLVAETSYLFSELKFKKRFWSCTLLLLYSFFVIVTWPFHIWNFFLFFR